MIPEDQELGFFRTVETLIATIVTISISGLLLLASAFPDVFWATGTMIVLFVIIRTIFALRKWYRQRRYRRKPVTYDPRLARARGRQL
jgi:uncharacterized membrane protein